MSGTTPAPDAPGAAGTPLQRVPDGTGSIPYAQRQCDPAKPLFGFPVADWHRWFAWRPVTTYDGRVIWLHTVERRLIQKRDWLNSGPDHWWQHRWPVTRL